MSVWQHAWERQRCFLPLYISYPLYYGPWAVQWSFIFIHLATRLENATYSMRDNTSENRFKNQHHIAHKTGSGVNSWYS